MEHEALLYRCKKGDRTAQKELYEMYNNMLFRISLKYCNSIADAEDNLHNASIDIFSSIQKYNGKGSFAGWLKRIAINKAIDSYKKTFHLSPIITDFCDDLLTDDCDFENLTLDNLLRMVQELPNQYRLVFCLFELDDYSHKEISEMLSISENTSKSNLHRAKMILKDRITSRQPAKIYKISNGK